MKACYENASRTMFDSEPQSSKITQVAKKSFFEIAKQDAWVRCPRLETTRSSWPLYRDSANHSDSSVPVLLDLLLCHSRAWLPRDESRSFPTSSSGIRDSSRAPDTRARMTEKFDRADVRVTILCRTQ